DMQTPLLSNAKSSKFNVVDTISFNIDETLKFADGSSKGNEINEYGEGGSKEIESGGGDSESENVQSSTLMITTMGRQKQKE
nr:hypothetical protein [Tanacetum cinerariifolium]